MILSVSGVQGNGLPRTLILNREPWKDREMKKAMSLETAKTVLDAALARAAARDANRIPIDYDAANRILKRQRAALTRAIKTSPDAVVIACKKAVAEWDKPGMYWPDDWSRWQRALDDCLPLGRSVQLEDLR